MADIIKRTGTEVLSPAGDFGRLKAAVDFGADAVYLGKKEFGMRAKVANFTDEELEKGVKYAHERGVKVYLTCNTLPRNDEIDRISAHIQHAYACGVDAVIVNDPGVIDIMKTEVPKMPIHMSVQTGIVNYRSAEFYHKLGAERIVLARELTLEEISEIRRRTSGELELEAFVHGAVCMSVSGRCLLSNYMTGRDANRGDCAQPCRWKYSLVEEKRPGQYFDIIEDDRGSHILNAKDMCLIEHLDKLYDAGIRSFKIEGRAKADYYVAATTAAYRAAADVLAAGGEYKVPRWALEEINNVSHREYSTAFYFGVPENGQTYTHAGYLRIWQIAGIVTGYEDGHIILSQRNRFYKGEVLSCLSPKTIPFEITADSMLGEDNSPIDYAPHPMMTVKIPYPQPVAVGSILRRTAAERD